MFGTAKGPVHQQREYGVVMMRKPKTVKEVLFDYKI